MKRTVMAIAALALALSACGGGGGSDSNDGGSGTDAPSNGVAAEGLASEGERLFGATCASCHGADAMGIDGLGKGLVASQFVADRDTDALLAFIQEGRLADHPDNTTGVAMPPRGGNPSLSDQDLIDIIAYLRTLQ